jgi:hypothetical protein
MGDIIVISVLVIIVGLIIFWGIKNRKKGCCAGCSKCKNAEASACNGCCHNQNNSYSS